MSDEVLVPYGENMQETATLLLGAADEKGYDVYVVRHQPDDSGFRVPADVAKAAGLTPVDEEKQAEVEAEEAREHAEEVARIAEENTQEGQDQGEEKPKSQPRKRAAKKTASKTSK